jgi:hypothetical protein
MGGLRTPSFVILRSPQLARVGFKDSDDATVQELKGIGAIGRDKDQFDPPIFCGRPGNAGTVGRKRV